MAKLQKAIVRQLVATSVGYLLVTVVLGLVTADAYFCGAARKTIFGGLFAIASLLVTAVLSMRQLRKRLQVEQDLTLANDALRKRDAFSNLIFESTRDCIKVLDLSHRLQFMNTGGQRLLEICEFEPFKNANWLDFWHGKDKEHAAQALSLARAGGVGRFVGYFPTTQTKQPKWFDVVVSPINNMKGTASELLIVSRDITDSMQAEELRTESIASARRSEEQIKQLMEAMPQIVWTANADGNLDFYNQRWFDYTGMTLEQTKGWGWGPVLHPDDLAQCVETWTRSVKSGHPYEVRYRFKRASDGTYRWHLGRAQPVRDEHGIIIKWIGTCTDINDEKQAIEDAHQAQQKLKTFLSSFPHIVWATDEQGIVTLSEGKGLAAIGLKPGQTVGWDMKQSEPGEGSSRNSVVRALAGESFFSSSCFQGRWVETSYSPMIESSGAISGMVAVSSDVTAQRLLRNELELSQERQRMALDAARIAHWDLDAESESFNYLGGLTVLYGRSETSPIRNAGEFLALVHPDDRSRVSSAIHRCLKEGVPYDATFRLLWSDGSTHWIHGKGNKIAPSSSSSARVTGVNIDITDQKALELALTKADEKERQLIISEKAAIQASEMKSRFLANMSHEIRTPINGVMGMASLLLDTELSLGQRNYAETIRGSADTLLILVNDILDLSKAEAGKIELENINFDLEQLVSDIERTLMFSANKKGLKLLRSVSTELPPYLIGDPTRISQVLVNLLNNAVKFTGHGQVTIEAVLKQRQGDAFEVLFEVTDSGIGISEEALGRMFQSFSQADSSTTRKYGGTGLGLSICKHLVSLMGGAIGVRSKPGEGSVFWFTVILASGKATEADRGGAVTLDGSARKLRILVAEDNSVNQLIAVKMLEKLGHSAVAVANGKEAIAALRVGDFDLVLMDCQMPELDGYDATKLIRADHAGNFSAIPIVAMTANAMTGDRDRCLSAGMTDYLSKPMKAKDLHLAIERNRPDTLKAA